jgi:hypothetical protein
MMTAQSLGTLFAPHLLCCKWNLSKTNLLWTNFCVQNRQVFVFNRLNQQVNL